MTREEILKNLVEEFYEDFNECERAQHLLDCEHCELYKKYGRCHLGEYITDYQMPIIKKAQADLLKEFVGYWHRHWGNNWGIYNYAVNDSVDIALEQFIKEREQMREIKFRAKTIKKKRWVYGDLIHQDNTIKIEDETGDRYCVEQDTVGQYTGLKDKNGAEIYEGDIVKFSDFEGKHRIGKVKYSIDTCCYRIVGDLFNYALILSQEDIEVIGNIYNNPELLEEKEK